MPCRTAILIRRGADPTECCTPVIETFVKESPWYGLGIAILAPEVVDMSFTFAQAAPFRAGIENVGTRNKTVRSMVFCLSESTDNTGCSPSLNGRFFIEARLL